jgi:uncharacterized membrane protein YtjA (UPF0391 family)
MAACIGSRRSVNAGNVLVQSIQENVMLNWIVTFFILAVAAAFLGFTGLAGTFADIAKFIAIIFVVLFIASLVYRMITGRNANPPL